MKAINQLKTLGLVALLGLGASNAYAVPVTVEGVSWDTDSLFDMSAVGSIFDAPGSVAFDPMGDPTVGVLSGHGRISEFNGTLSADFCTGCELTYEFGGYVMNDQSGGMGGPFSGVDLTTGDFSYTGGWLNVYVGADADGFMNFDGTDVTTSTDGVLFLSLVAAANPVTGNTLDGSINLADFNGGLGFLQGTGSGFFDVEPNANPLSPEFGMSGVANALFDTSNVFGTDKDLFFNSDFAPDAGIDAASGGLFTHSGSFDLRGDTVAVPEPGFLALMGLGLLGMSATRRKK